MNEWNPALYDQKHSFVFAYGNDLLALLQPQPAELILDLGCGTGHLTNQIVQTGARAIGVDNSPSMLATARQNYPELEFRLADAAEFTMPEQFDAVFSNAALHWVTRAEEAVTRIARALKPQGRFVAEFGGKGNVGHIIAAVQSVLHELTGQTIPHGWYYPSVSEYGYLLEKHGLEVRQASLFDRPTALEGADGMRNWLAMFAEGMFRSVLEEVKEMALQQIEERLRGTNYGEGTWFADYRRLRIVAIKE